MPDGAHPVTIVIPNYNGSRYLNRTLSQLLGQTYRHFSLIVVDDGSTDDSFEIVHSLADSRLQWVAGSHLGLPLNFNRAIQLVESPYFAACSYDEMYEPEWLAAMVQLLESSPLSFFACCKADSCDSSDSVYLAHPERYKDSFWPKAEPCYFEMTRGISLLMSGCFLICTAGLYRTAAFRDIGYFSEQWKFVGDWEHFVRGLLAGYTIVGTHRRLAHYRRHDGMATQKLGPRTRFLEYVKLSSWIAEIAHANGIIDHYRANYSVVRNQLLSEFAELLWKGEYDAADQLVDLAREAIPGFRGSLIDGVARTSRLFGRGGGMLLTAARNSLLRVAPARAHV